MGQSNVEVIKLKETPFETDMFVGYDNLGGVYAVKNNSLQKVFSGNSLNFSNIQLGNISSSNIFNPLKINLFYKNFNTVILLDNRLTEILKLDFNTLTPYKNISHLSTGPDTTLWIFNQDIQQLELFDYKTRKTRTTGLPVSTKVLSLSSNYNYCWLLTEAYLYQYNYMGSLLYKLPNNGFAEIVQWQDYVVAKKGSNLFVIVPQLENPLKIELPGLLIKQFSITGETLYIYDSKKLHEFQLIIN